MATLSQPPESGPAFVCPACHGALEFAADRYHCTPCRRDYPVLFGIPDFRLRPDRYLTLEEERAKAGRLHAVARTASFEELLAYYYSITDDVPPALAARYQAYIRNAPGQALAALAALRPDAGKDVLLDLGCGAGGFLVAAHGRYRQVVGVDIALRWLVICKRRLDELGMQAQLVCADAERLPFAGGGFTQLVAADLVEHVYDVQAAIEQCREQLVPGGRLWLTASNRYCLGPHPLTRVWGIGFLPRAARRALLLRLRGVDSLRYTNLVAPRGIRRLCRQAHLRVLQAGPRTLNIADISAYPPQDRILIRAYRGALRLAPLRALLLYAGPAFEMLCEKQYPTVTNKS